MSPWCYDPITSLGLALVLPLVPTKIQAVTEFPDCDEVDFLCANGACVNSSLLCDGKDDCGDSSDEQAKFARCSDVLSGGLIAAIVIGCLVGAVLVCCWVGSVIECIQHMYKYWCSCCHPSGDLSDITFTTVIPNPGADPSTLMIATTLPPSYSSIFCQDHGIPPGAIMPPASYAACPRATNSIAVQVPEYSPPGYDNTKSDVRWC